MRRQIYRALIALHPPNFREQHGDEMLCVFDESPVAGSPELFVDGVHSLARQWLLHSGIWKLAIGGVVSAFALVGWAYSMNREFRWSMEWSAKRNAEIGALYPHRRISPLDHQQFAREAAEAAAKLRTIEGSHRHEQHSEKVAFTHDDSSSVDHSAK